MTNPPRSKADWALGKAATLREQIRTLRFESSGGSYARAARKMQAIRSLEAEAARFERIATCLRARAA